MGLSGKIAIVTGANAGERALRHGQCRPNFSRAQLSVKVAPGCINVNAVAPGLIATPMTQQLLNWCRDGEPVEIAGLVLSLVSNAVAYVTDQTSEMNGVLATSCGGA